MQSLDTNAPDQLLAPAFQLNYDWHASDLSKLSFSFAYTPNFYSVNPAFSFHETALGATGLFYLSNQEAISAMNAGKGSEIERMPGSPSHFLEFGITGDYSTPVILTPMRFELESHSTKSDDSKDDSLVNVAVSALYTLSGELDSTDIITKGISKSRISDLEDLRDSISDVLTSIADVLDSVGYSESVAQIIQEELKHLKPRLAELMPLTKKSHTNPKLLDAAIRALDRAEPEPDVLATTPTPSAIGSLSDEKKSVLAQLTGSALLGPAKTSTPAPVLTLVSSNERLREFGYNDVQVHEDIDDSDATTLATSLTVPVSYTSHSATSYSPSDSVLFGTNYGGNPNDTKVFAMGAAIEALPSGSFSLRASYDFTRTVNPFDSVYTNTENRVGLLSRVAAGASTVLFGELSVGLRSYLDPLQVQVVTQVKPGKKGPFDTTRTVAGSKFSQFSYGLGLSQFIGERWTIGALAAYNRNPNLRAYITTAQIQQLGKTRAIRAAVQIADDEYTYNLSRYTLFTAARIFSDIDLGFDFSYEDRTYGSATGPRGGVLQAGRTEAARFWNISLSKLLPFEDRLVGVFNAALIEAKLQVSRVSSSQSLYNYSTTVFSVGGTLAF